MTIVASCFVLQFRSEQVNNPVMCDPERERGPSLNKAAAAGSERSSRLWAAGDGLLLLLHIYLVCVCARMRHDATAW